MKKICFCFHIHQPFRLRTYRFFDIGNNTHYFDEAKNRSEIQKVAEKCYLPANKILLRLIREYGDRFKVSFSISGTALDQIELYAPEVLESFRELTNTGCIEFLAETYSHSLSSLISTQEFKRQVKDHSKKIEHLFGQKPTAFRNTELIYSDKIGMQVSELGFKSIVSEGANHILDWRSPNYMYCSASNPHLKLLFKNCPLSDDIAFRFSRSNWNEWPLTAEKFSGWLNNISHKEELINLFMDYETFGINQGEETGIFDFLRALPHYIFSSSSHQFVTVSKAAELIDPVAQLSIPNPVSKAKEQHGLSAWLGNDIQNDAFESLYRLEKKVKKITDKSILSDWSYLQTSNHFQYMDTRIDASSYVHEHCNPYYSPYDAFINYMNVLSDFEERVNKYIPVPIKKDPVKRKIQIIKERRLATVY